MNEYLKVNKKHYYFTQANFWLLTAMMMLSGSVLALVFDYVFEIESLVMLAKVLAFISVWEFLFFGYYLIRIKQYEQKNPE